MSMDSQQLAELAADACDDRKAQDIRLIRVDEVSSLADWMGGRCATAEATGPNGTYSPNSKTRPRPQVIATPTPNPGVAMT